MVIVQQPLGFLNFQTAFSRFCVLLERRDRDIPTTLCHSTTSSFTICCAMSSCEGQGLLHPKHMWALGSEATMEYWLQSVVQAANSRSKSEHEECWASWCCWQKRPLVSIRRVYPHYMAPGPDMHPNTPSCLSVGWVSTRSSREYSARRSQAFGNEYLDIIESHSLDTLNQIVESPLHIIRSVKGLTSKISQLWAKVGPSFTLQPEMCAQDVDRFQWPSHLETTSLQCW